MTDHTTRDGFEQNFSPEIRRARMQTLTIYEVSESELETLERGAPDSIFLNISLFLFSCAMTSLVALLTCKFTSSVTNNGFLLAAIIGFSIGSVLFVLWCRNRKTSASVIAGIRDRLPPQGESKTV